MAVSCVLGAAGLASGGCVVPARRAADAHSPAAGTTAPTVAPATTADTAAATAAAATAAAATAAAATAAALWDAGAYAELVVLGEQVAPLLLNAQNRDYYTTVVIAHAAMKTSRWTQAIPFYERALYLQTRSDTLAHYWRCVEAAAVFDRAEAFFADLATHQPTFADELATFELRARFRLAVMAGDAALWTDRDTAAAHYERAMQLYRRLPTPTERPADLPSGDRALDRDYTTWQLYTDAESWKRRRYEEPVLLFAKYAMVGRPVPARDDARRLRYAAVVVRHTDYAYTTAAGTTYRERNTLDDVQLAAIREAWQLVTALVQHYSSGRLVVDSDWFDLGEEVTLTGLKLGHYNDLFETIHFDPAALEPLPIELFNRISRDYDGVVFVWPRGDSPKHYGGGRQRLPPAGDGAVLNYIGSLTDRAQINLHEFLHAFEHAMPAGYRVHGPPIDAVPADFNGNTDLDWLLYGVGIDNTY